MVHTVYLDDKYLNIKCLLKEISRQEQGVRFEYPYVADTVVEKNI